MADRGLAYQTPTADMIVNVSDLSNRDYRWLQRATGVALTSSHGAQKLGALALRGGKPIAWAVNRFRNHPRVVDDWRDCSVHAEQSLIESCDVSGAIVYVARVTNGGNVAIAKPCRRCLRLLSKAGARRVVWTDDDGHAGMMALG